MRLVLFMFVYLTMDVGGTQTYFFEKMNNFGLGMGIGRRSRYMGKLLDLHPESHPKPLPPRPPSELAMIPTPYKTLYQGNRLQNDTRVFRQRFDYEPRLIGHKVLCEGIFDCQLSHLAVETSEAIPILLRGGAGYRHFSVIIRAKPGRALKGVVRAYCRQRDLEDIPALKNLVARHRRRYMNKVTPLDD